MSIGDEGQYISGGVPVPCSGVCGISIGGERRAFSGERSNQKWPSGDGVLIGRGSLYNCNETGLYFTLD